MTTPLEDRVSRLEGAYDHLATKADLAELRAELKGDTGGLTAELRDDIAKVKADLIKWMIGTMVGNVAATTSIVVLVAKLTGWG